MTQMAPPLFDSHAHLTCERFAEQERQDILRRALAAQVMSIMNVATDGPSLDAGLALANESSTISIYCAAATTPHDIASDDDPFFSAVAQAAQSGLLAAIGETGFDFFHAPHTVERQKTVFLRYALLAQQARLPLIVHCRDAFPTLLNALHDIGEPLNGVLHCFTGTTDEARALLERGWFLSFSGIVTFPSATALREAVRFVPQDRLLVETDAPYLAPQEKRGQRNEPAYLHSTVEAIAAIQNCSYERVAEATWTNARTLFTDNE